MDNSFDFDTPHGLDFTALSRIETCESDSHRYSDWFERGPVNNENEDTERDESESEPSPVKRQKMSDATAASSKSKPSPRRSPRLLTKPQQAQKNNKIVRSNSKAHALPNKGRSVHLVNNEYESVNMKGKTSEQLELERIAEMKDKLSAARKRNLNTYKAVIASKPRGTYKSEQPCTLPESFHFHSDMRIRGLPERVPEIKTKDFTAILRDGSSKSKLGSSKSQMELTCPQPFKLSRSKKASTSSQDSEKYQSCAEKIAAFHKKTPDRFKCKPEAKLTTAAGRLHHLTIAKTPTLSTRGRSRSVKVISKVEQDAAEFREHQKQQFKAHPVNHRILAVPNVGVQKVASKPATVPQEFHLHQSLVKPQHQESEDKEFHAKPVNKKMFEGPMGVKPVEPHTLTIPQSPAFALRSRLRLPKQEPEQVTASAPSRHHHVPHAGIPFRPKLEHVHTVPQPFAVDERSKQMLKRKEEKIMQVYEEEKKAREFEARLLPSDEPDRLPPKKLRPVTEPEPFQLEVDSRGQKYQQEYRLKQMEEENRQAKAQAEFKANPSTVIFKAPFLPEKSYKPLTEFDDFALNTDVRANKREHFNQFLKAREANVSAIRHQVDALHEIEEKAAVAKLRHDMVHKATGVKSYKGVVVHVSEKPLTEPQSPYLHTKRVTRTTSSDQ